MGLYTHLTGGESRCIVQPFFLAAVPKVYSAVGEQIDQCGGADGLTMKDWCCETLGQRGYLKLHLEFQRNHQVTSRIECSRVVYSMDIHLRYDLTASFAVSKIYVQLCSDK